MVCDNITVNNGRLYFAGQDTVGLAGQYGTPLYLMDEDKVRENCRLYTGAFSELFPSGSLPHYASKANSFKHIYRIMAEEGMGIDVVSSGELYTALAAGFPMSDVCFHGNNKTDEDIKFGIANHIGYFIADNCEEVLTIEKFAAEAGVVQNIQLRITPGIDPHTYAAVATGLVDSKFGSAIETGQAYEITELALKQPHVRLCGFHCHVGSQVFGEDVFERAADVMLRFIRAVYDRTGYMAGILDLGGGYGVPYTAEDPVPDIRGSLAKVAATIKNVCSELAIPEPAIMMEPGRSIVADAGMTLYTVGAVKKLPGYKNYISIDGGMSDNPRYALYGSKYTTYIANRMDEECTMKADLVGRCCESGDVIAVDTEYPASTCRGDIAAVCITGAYNYSMASNYNRIGRPAMVMLRGGGNSLAVKRESFEDMLRNEI